MSARPPLLRRRWVRLSAFLVLVVVLAVLPLLVNPNTNQTIGHIAVFAVAILGLNILMGYTGQVSLGHIFFLGVGAYCAALPVKYWWGGAMADGAIWIGLVLSIVLPGIIAFLVALAAVRLRGLALAMVTIALPIVSGPLAKRFSDFTGGNEGVSVSRLQYADANGQMHTGNPFAAPAGLGLANDQWQYYLCVGLGLVCFVLAHFLVRGKYGRAFAIVRTNESVAGAMGISPYWTKVLAFTIAGIIGGVAGFLYIAWGQYTSSDMFSFANSIQLVIATIVGGAGTIVGAVLGGAFFVLVPQLTNAWGLGQYTLVAQGVVILLVLFLLPGGLASLPRVIRRLARRGRADHSVGAGDMPGPASRITEMNPDLEGER